MIGLRYLVLFSTTLASANTYAYIDPASGSAIISALIGLIVTGGVMIKSYWRSLTTKFLKRTETETETETETGTDTDTDRK